MRYFTTTFSIPANGTAKTKPQNPNTLPNAKSANIIAIGFKPNFPDIICGVIK